MHFYLKERKIREHLVKHIKNIVSLLTYLAFTCKPNSKNESLCLNFCWFAFRQEQCEIEIDITARIETHLKGKKNVYETKHLTI